MGLMTTSTFDPLALDAKSAALSSADAMPVGTDAHGAPPKYDALFDDPESHLSEKPAPPAVDAQAPPTLNGNHPSSDTAAPALEPVLNVTAGLDPVAPFLPDSQTNANALFDGSEVGMTSIPHAVEAPTSDVRKEPPTTEPAGGVQGSAESTQHVPETQLEPMDTSHGGPASAAGHATAQGTHAPPTKPMNDLTLESQNAAVSPPVTQSPTVVDHDMEDAPASGKVRSREEDDEGDAPDAKRTRTGDSSNQAEFKVPDLPSHPEQTNGIGAGAAVSSAANQTHVQSAVASGDWPDSPMTPLQNKFLLERVRNTKKIKVATAFKDPVDHVALNIPQYPELIKNPMDLTTMETKLKDGKYTLVREFLQDLDLIIDNSVKFNGNEHPVTQAGFNMRAYFLKGMAKMPRSDVAEEVKQPKPKKPAVAIAHKPRRESRVAATAKSPTAPTPTAASPQTPWPLNADGMPLIRRDSSSANDRPKREIHRPPPKDLPYNTAKPKKKKYQQELKFCESVMTEIMKPKYQKFSYPFLKPVDPVALNIPTYLKIIKKPMDFGTIEKNLQQGQYQTAKDFHNDAQLVFANCFKFNPEGDEVNKMGHMLQDLFNELWKEKGDWLATHAPTSDPQSPGSAYSEDEEEEEEEETDPAQEQILAIQKQIQALNETAQQLLQQKAGKRTSPKVAGKKKSAKAAAAPKKKTSLAVPPPVKAAKAKPKSKPAAPLSFAQKQEISDGISTLGDAEMRKAVQIIRNGCPHLANVNDDEMEIDMDEIGDETLRELFKFIKAVRGPKGTVDEDFEPVRATAHKPSAAQRPKKNKPMGKKEQEDNIKKIQEQLRNFEASASGSSQSPPANQDESSDDESSGSESEEE